MSEPGFVIVRHTWIEGRGDRGRYIETTVREAGQAPGQARPVRLSCPVNGVRVDRAARALVRQLMRAVRWSA